jgi:hypothetical protein
VKRTDRHEPIGIVIHICMETTQGNFLCIYLYLRLAKMPCFSNYVLCFIFYKTGGPNRFSVVGGAAGIGEGEGGGEMDRR